MPESEFDEAPSRLKVSDILFVLFKQKRQIIACTAVGVVAAAIVYCLTPALFRSDAKLFVPYVVNRTTVDTGEEATPTSRENDTIINSETEILSSWDLAAETAKTMRYDGFDSSSTDPSDNSEVIRDITKRIEIVANKGMNVITISYKDRNPTLATHYLQELLKNYREKHLRIHRFPEALDVLVQRRDDVRKRLAESERELKQLKEQAQVLSLADTISTLSAAIVKNQEELNRVEAERRAQESRVEALETLMQRGTTSGEKTAAPRATPQEVDQYRSLIEQVSQLRAKESQLLLTYPPDSRMVKIPRKQISDLEEQRQMLENKFPELVATAAPGSPQTPIPDIISEKARLAALKATGEVTKQQFEDLQRKRDEFLALSPKIAQLERDKELLEANYKNIEATLSKAQDDKAVDWSKIPNIATVQEPSPGARVTDPFKKKLMVGFLTGGLLFGIGLAFIRERILDRTIKRVSELEGRLGIPVLMSIPYAATYDISSETQRLRYNDSQSREERETDVRSAAWAADHFIRPFCEAIRDRVILALELRNVTRKPKLIGVTSFSKGAGSSTLAGGLAAALSETGDGKVLLVDMNRKNGEVHPFFDGKAASSLTSILEPKSSIPSAAENLYLATVGSGETERLPLGLKRFCSLVPSLKTADFDYIIFDMPAVGGVCPTLGMSAFMDKVLVVIEAERDDQDAVKRLYSELAKTKTDVSCVFNKVRSHAPKWIEALN